MSSEHLYCTLMKSSCQHNKIFHQRVWRTPEHWVPHHLPRHGACTGHANLLCQTGLSNSSIILPSAYFVVFSQISGFGNTQTYLVRRVCPCIKYFDITSIWGLVDFCIFLLLNALFLFSAQNRGWSKWRHECGKSSHFQHRKASLPGQLIF